MFTFFKNLFSKPTSISFRSISGNELKIYRSSADDSTLLFTNYSVDKNKLTTIALSVSKAKTIGQLIKENIDSYYDLSIGVRVWNDAGDMLWFKKDWVRTGAEYFLYMTRRENPSEEIPIMLKRDTVKKISKFLIKI